MLSKANIQTLNELAIQQKVSVSQVVRHAIDAFNPVFFSAEESALMELASLKLKETLAQTDKTNTQIEQLFKEMDERQRDRIQ